MKYIQLLLYILLLLLWGCSGNNSSSEETPNGKLYIVSTTGMIHDIVSNIGGSYVEAVSLMGPGVDPHLYKATRTDLQELRKADAIFYNGLHLEGKMGEILEKLSKQKPTFPIGEAIPKNRLHSPPDQPNAIDPHVWFDVSLWIKASEYVAAKLTEIDSTHATEYAQALEKYSKELSDLHVWTQLEINHIPEESRVLITAHDAFGYFGKAYGIEVRGLQGISTMSEFGLKDVAELVDFIVERKIKAVFVESSIPTKSLEAVQAGCKQKNHLVQIGGSLYSDAMGEAGTDEGTYIGMVKANVTTIVKALQ